MKNIKLPDSVTTIGAVAFMNCNSLQKIDLKYVTDIGDGWQHFYNCSSLTSVGDASNITRIGIQCFGSCESLESINISNKCTYIGREAFANCTNLKSTGDISSVSSFGQYTWYNTALTNFTIPFICTKIDQYCFADCTSMKYIQCLATTPPTLDNHVFYNCNNCPIYVPDESLDTYKSATNWSNYTSRIKPMSEFTES